MPESEQLVAREEHAEFRRPMFRPDPITTFLARRGALNELGQPIRGFDDYGEPLGEWVTDVLDGLDPACRAEEFTSPVDAPLPASADADAQAPDPDYDEISFGGLIEEATDGSESGSGLPDKAGHG